MLICVLALAFFSCKKEGNVVIRGEIENLEHPYILASYISGDTLALDTIGVDGKGKFSYRNTIDTLTVFTIYFNDYSTSTVVFAGENQKITLHGDALLPDLIKVTGSEINNDLTSFKNENEDLLRQRGNLLVNLNRKNNESIVSSVLVGSEDMAHLNSLNYELMQKAEEFVKENPAKMSSLVLINDFFTDGENSTALQRVLGYLEGSVAKSRMAGNLKSYSEKMSRSAEGVLMPYFQLADKDEKTIRSNDFRGKFLVLSFLSATGGQSRENVSALKKSYENLPKDSISFVSIYVDSDVHPVEYLEQDSIPWTVVAEKESWAADIVETYNVQFLPYNILITPEGIIKDRNIPAQQIANSVRNSTKN